MQRPQAVAKYGDTFPGLRIAARCSIRAAIEADPEPFHSLMRPTGHRKAASPIFGFETRSEKERRRRVSRRRAPPPMENSMNDNRTPAPRGIRTARRLVLLASTAGLGIAVLLGGPGGIPNFSALSSTAALAQTQQRPAGFADVVEKVKPAIISVRVRSEERRVGKECSSRCSAY